MVERRSDEPSDDALKDLAGLAKLEAIADAIKAGDNERVEALATDAEYSGRVQEASDSGRLRELYERSTDS